MAASGNVLRRSSTYSKFFEKMELQGMTARQCFKKKMAFSHTDPENPWTPTPVWTGPCNLLWCGIDGEFLALVWERRGIFFQHAPKCATSDQQIRPTWDSNCGRQGAKRHAKPVALACVCYLLKNYSAPWVSFAILQFTPWKI
jgi:hypothetical protein